MAKSVFFSFHYERDNWRVQQILRMGALEGQPILNSQQWEQVKRRGSAAVERWIDEQMRYKKAVVVLVGAQTAGRPWVQYEIEKAWAEKRPLVGVRINGLLDASRRPDPPGADPFAKLTAASFLGGRPPLYAPRGATSQQIHADIAHNLTSWVANARTR